MMCLIRRATVGIFVALLGTLSGCASARFVSKSPDCGVVAIPCDSNRWPTYNRDKAEALIRSQCPDGYEVVHEEEAVIGSVSHTSVNDNGSIHTAGSTSGTIDTTQKTEWRIHYRRKEGNGP